MVVAAGALIRPDGCILMHKRSATSAHGGLWEFPGGKLEGEESPQIALARELCEELGIAINSNVLRPVGFASNAPDIAAGQRAILIVLYAARQWIGEPECLEGEAIGWFSLERMCALQMPPLDVPLAARLVELLDAGLI